MIAEKGNGVYRKLVLDNRYVASIYYILALIVPHVVVGRECKEHPSAINADLEPVVLAKVAVHIQVCLTGLEVIAEQIGRGLVVHSFPLWLVNRTRCSVAETRCSVYSTLVLASLRSRQKRK